MTVYSVPVDHPSTQTVADVQAAGFTHVGPWYGNDRDAAAATAAALGMCVVYQVGPVADANAALGQIDEIRASMEADIAAVLADPELDAAVSMWSILPEEMNVYRTGHQAMLEQLAATVREADPRQRPIFMYLQSNADEHQFEVSAQHTHVLGQGLYLATNGRAHERIRIRASVERAQAAREAVGLEGRFVMPVLERRINDGLLPESEWHWIPTWVHHDVFTTIAAGADGFIAFSGWPPRERQADFEIYRDAYADAVELIRRSGLADLWATGEVRGAVRGTVTAGPGELSAEVLFIPMRSNPVETFPSFAVRTWQNTDGTEELTVLTNSASEPISVDLTGLGGGRYVELLSGREILAPAGTLSVNLEPYGVALLRLADSD